MSAHTPGPWFWADNVPDAPPHYRMIVDADGATVCDPSPMSEHDARLIAAAPALLAALQLVAHCLAWHERQHGAGMDAHAVEQARAAIERATNEAP